MSDRDISTPNSSPFERIVGIFVNPNNNGFPILALLIGAFCIYLGYKLFDKNILEGGAALSFSYGDGDFNMGKGGPGLLFSFFGIAMIIYAISKYQKLKS